MSHIPSCGTTRPLQSQGHHKACLVPMVHKRSGYLICLSSHLSHVGELICFFRAPPRIVRNPLHEMSASPSLRAQENAPRLFRAPASLSDAINHLTVASNDRTPSNTSRRTEDAANILRIMTNLLTFSQGKRRRVSERSKPANDDVPYALLPTRRSTVFIKPAASIGHPDRIIASQYHMDMSKPGESCRANASIAKQHGRHDHERVFKTLQILVEGYSARSSAIVLQKRILGSPGTKLARNMLFRFIRSMKACTNWPFVAMLSYASRRTSRCWRWLLSSSCVVKTCYKKLRVRCQSDRPFGLLSVSPPGTTQVAIKPPRSVPARPSRRKESRSFSTSHNWYQVQPSPGVRRMSTAANTPSSRGSWSSLFNTGSVRQFMAGAQHSPDIGSPGVPDGGLSGRLPVPEAMKRKEPSRASSQSPLKRGVAKSWSESSPHAQNNLSVMGARRPMPSGSPSTEKMEKPLNNKKLVVVIALRDDNR